MYIFASEVPCTFVSVSGTSNLDLASSWDTLQYNNWLSDKNPQTREEYVNYKLVKKKTNEILSDDCVSNYSSSGEEYVPESDTSENSDIEVDEENVVKDLAQEHRFVHVELVIGLMIQHV
ncbi:hypothetical protein FQA39_LY18759 [Lamprigera yunnana]|nr:hypothetical protein FQA39_LY18759 [Lamprigera yunnana]